MKKLTRALCTTALLCASLAAHATDDTYQFQSITGIEYLSQALPPFQMITGLLVNSSTPTTIAVPNYGVSCSQYYDLMMRKPGKYTLNLTIRTTQTFDPAGSPMTRRDGLNCSITRNP